MARDAFGCGVYGNRTSLSAQGVDRWLRDYIGRLDARERTKQLVAPKLAAPRADNIDGATGRLNALLAAPCLSSLHYAVAVTRGPSFSGTSLYSQYGTFSPVRENPPFFVGYGAISDARCRCGGNGWVLSALCRQWLFST